MNESSLVLWFRNDSCGWAYEQHSCEDEKSHSGYFAPLAAKHETLQRLKPFIGAP